MSAEAMTVLIGSVIVIIGLGVFAIVYLLRENRRLKNFIQAYGAEILELEKEKVRTRAEEQRIETQTARSSAEEATRVNEIKKTNTLNQEIKAVDSEIEREKKFKELLIARGKNTAVEIQERKAKIKAGINPDPAIPTPPKTRFEKFSDGMQKHWFFSFVALIILIIILHKLNII